MSGHARLSARGRARRPPSGLRVRALLSRGGDRTCRQTVPPGRPHETLWTSGNKPPFAARRCSSRPSWLGTCPGGRASRRRSHARWWGVRDGAMIQPCSSFGSGRWAMPAKGRPSSQVSVRCSGPSSLSDFGRRKLAECRQGDRTAWASGRKRCRKATVLVALAGHASERPDDRKRRLAIGRSEPDRFASRGWRSLFVPA